MEEKICTTHFPPFPYPSKKKQSCNEVIGKKVTEKQTGCYEEKIHIKHEKVSVIVMISMSIRTE